MIFEILAATWMGEKTKWERKNMGTTTLSLGHNGLVPFVY